MDLGDVRTALRNLATELRDEFVPDVDEIREAIADPADALKSAVLRRAVKKLEKLSERAAETADGVDSLEDDVRSVQEDIAEELAANAEG